MINAITKHGITRDDATSQPCAFCGEPVDPQNYLIIPQAVYDGDDRGALLQKEGSRVIVLHVVCGLPKGTTLQATDDDNPPDSEDFDEDDTEDG